MHGSLFEVWKPTVGHLHVRVDSDGPGGLIRFISDEIAAYQVDWTAREADQGSKFLVQPIWDRLESKDALPQDHTTWIDAENWVHVSGNIEFL